MIDCATSKNMATANGAGFDGYHDHHIIKGNIFSCAWCAKENYPSSKASKWKTRTMPLILHSLIQWSHQAFRQYQPIISIHLLHRQFQWTPQGKLDLNLFFPFWNYCIQIYSVTKAERRLPTNINVYYPSLLGSSWKSDYAARMLKQPPHCICNMPLFMYN